MAATLCQVLSAIMWLKISGQKKATWLVGEVDMALQLALSQVTSMPLYCDHDHNMNNLNNSHVRFFSH